VTAERRLSAVEAALTPTELVVAWLAEAHAFGSLEDAVRSMLAAPEPVPPMDQLARAASDGARSRMKGRPAEERNKAIDTAVTETIFRFRLVLRITTVTCDLLDRQLLLDAVFALQFASLMGVNGKAGGPSLLPDLIKVRDLIVGRVDELLAHQQAREAVERRYLAGHPALFPDRQAEWTERLALTMRLGVMAIGVCEKDGIAPATPGLEAGAARTERLVSDLVEPSRVEALEDLGQGRRAFGIATSWLRGRSVPT
jgi:hypothetical protein